MLPIVVIGAGPAGCFIAGLLARQGHRVVVFDKRTHLSTATGQTISLSISPRGMRMLDRVGLGHTLRQHGVAMHGRAFHEAGGTVRFQGYAMSTWANYAVSRQTLSELLVQWAIQQGVHIVTGVSCIEYLWRDRAVVLQYADDTIVTQHAQLVIGADGSASEVRSALVRNPHFDSVKRAAPQVYHEVHIHPGAITQHLRAIHIWPRGDWFVVAMPDVDGSLRGTWVMSTARNDAFVAQKAHVEALCDAIPKLAPFIDRPRLATSEAAPITTIRLNHYHLDDHVVLVGDAAHAMAPFLGQGVNIALEDCHVLADLIAAHPSDMTTALERFSQMRVGEGLACADISQANFDALVRGTPPQDDPKHGVVARVNFLLHDYQDVAHTLWPDWQPRV